MQCPSKNCFNNVKTLAGVHMNRRPSSSAYQNPLSIISNIKSGTFKASAKNVTFRDPDFLVANEIHRHYEFKKSGKFARNQMKFSCIFHKVSQFTMKGKITPCFPPRTFVASAVANRLTRHLSDLQIHNDLPGTVLEANVGKLCHSCWVRITSE